MSARTLSAVAFKVFAIYLCVQIILYVPGIWSMYRQLGQWGSSDEIISFAPYMVSSLFLLFGLAIVSVLYKLGTSVLSSMPSEVEKSNVETIEPLLFQLLGSYFIISALSYLPANIILAFFDNIYNQNGLSQLSKRLEVLSYIVELVVGFTMVIKSHVWKNIFQKLRYAGSMPYNK